MCWSTFALRQEPPHHPIQEHPHDQAQLPRIGKWHRLLLGRECRLLVGKECRLLLGRGRRHGPLLKKGREHGLWLGANCSTGESGHERVQGLASVCLRRDQKPQVKSSSWPLTAKPACPDISTCPRLSTW